MEKNKEIKNETQKILFILQDIERKLDELIIDIDFYADTDKLIELDDKKKKTQFDGFGLSPNIKKKQGNQKFDETFLRERFNYNQLVNKIETARKEKIEQKEKLDHKKEKLRIKLKALERESKLNNESLVEITNALLSHYHSLLNIGKDTRKEGLVWIIKAIWNLGFEVVISFMPSFLDDKAIHYLFQYAQHDIELEKINEEIEEIKINVKLFHQTEMYDKKDKVIFKTDPDDLRLYKMNKKQSIKTFTKFKEDIAEKEKLGFKVIKEIIDKSKRIDEKSKLYIKNITELENKLKEKKELMNELKQRELFRINKEFLTNNYGRRFNIDQISLISAIVGQENSAAELSKKMREEKEYFNKLNICRTFNFIPPPSKTPLTHSAGNSFSQNLRYSQQNEKFFFAEII